MKLPLHDNERVLIKTREHSRVLRQPFVTFLVFTAACTFSLGYLSRPGLPAWLAQNTAVLSGLCVLLWFLLVLIWCLAPLLRWQRSRIVLTTERIMFRTARTGGKLDSVGLYAVRDLVAYNKKKGASTRPGTLDVLMNHGYTRLLHVPAVAYFRSLAISAISDMGSGPQAADHGQAVNGEGNDR